MKQVQRCVWTATLALLLSCASLWAQSPSGQFGVGALINGGGTFAGVPRNSGSAAHVVYAINPAIHLGASFRFESIKVEDVSSTGLLFGVFGKFLLAGPREFKPFILANFGVGTTSIEDASSSYQALSAAVGGEYFATPNVGIFAGIGLLQLQFGDVEATIVGIGGPFIGAEWFF